LNFVFCFLGTRNSIPIMLVSTEGIVLHFIKYGESSVIVTIYTRDFGRQSYLVNAARSKKSQNKVSLLQSLFLVDMVAYQKQSRELHRIKELRSHQVYQNIPFEITKSSLSNFYGRGFVQINQRAGKLPRNV
jgi:DNA repair protein RecO (recombination protein O)